MSIQKFKTFEEAEKALWNFNPDSGYYKRIGAFFKLFSKLSKFSYPNGIFKFHSFEEAQKHKMNLVIEAALKKHKANNE